MIWSIRGTPHHILGSIHALPEGDPIPSWARDALLGKVRIYFESDHADPQVAEIGIDREGRHLSDPRVAEIYKRAARLLEEIGRTDPFDALLPWRAGLFFAFAILGHHRISVTSGVDLALRAMAEGSGVEVGFLESPTRALDIFDSCQEPQAGERFFDYAVTNHQIATTEFGAIHSAWLTGDIRSLERIADEKRKLFPEFFTPLIDRRNAEWADTSVSLLAAEPPTLIVVGALHLAGPNSFLSCLADRGFPSDRI